MENKEVISYSEIHGFVFNMGTLHINEDLLKETLVKETIDSNDKRELIHAYYVREITKHDFLTAQTNYGDCEISFSRHIVVVDDYVSQILEKLNQQVTMEELKAATDIMDKICRMDDKEIALSQQLILEPFKKLIGLNPAKTPKM